MSIVGVSSRLAETSPQVKARIAGAFFFLTMLTAALSELVLRGKSSDAADVAAALIEVSGMAAVTLLLYYVFKPVNRRLSLFAAVVNVMGLICGALRWTPRGVDIIVVFAGFSCLMTSYLIFKSTFLPRILAAPMALAGLGWLTYMAPRFADNLSPYNLASGILGQGLVMLWLLLIGVDAQRWQEQASAAGSRDSGGIKRN